MEQGDLIEDAVERAGIDPASLTHRHINSINRSLMLVFTEIERIIPAEYRMIETDLALATNQGAVTLPANCIDVSDVMLLMDDDSVLPMRRHSRQDYLQLNRGDPAGTPTAWWVSKSMPGEVGRLPQPASASDRMLLVLWPNADSHVSGVRVSYIRETIDPTTLGATIDARREWWETIIRGLATKVAQKYNPERFSDLRAEYAVSLANQNQDMHPVVIGWRGFGRSRGRRS